MGAIRKTPRERAFAEFTTHRETLRSWEGKRSAAQAELESLQSQAGEQVLVDETAAERLPREMAVLRDRADIAGRAAAAVSPKVEAARRAVLEAEAAEWDAEVGKRRQRLADHESRTVELLDMLAEHEGVFVAARVAAADAHRDPGTGQMVSSIDHALGLKSDPMHDEVRRAELTAMILRSVAAGEDPAGALTKEAWIYDEIAGVKPRDLYPPSVWGPDAVMAAPAYLRAVGNAQDKIRAIDAEAAELPDRIVVAQAREVELNGTGKVAALPKLRSRFATSGQRRAEAEQERKLLTDAG